MLTLNPINWKTLKKLTALTLITATAGLGLAGCSTNPYELYQKAQDKTDNAQTGVYEVSVSLENQFDTSGLSEEALKAVNYMKQIAYKGRHTVDKSQDALISDAWINLGGIGFDFTYYAKGDQQYVKYPVLKKYIDLKQLMASTNAEGTMGDMPAISEDTQKQLSGIWGKLATQETVKSLEEVIIPTAQGDMKAKHLTIDVSGEAVKQALLESQAILQKDPAIEKMMAAQLAKAGESPDVTYTMMNDDMTIEDFEISSYIDADGYLVKDEVKINLGGFGSGNALKTSVFHMTTVYSQLGQPLDLDFPEITPDQVFTSEELNTEMPAVFKDLIN